MSAPPRPNLRLTLPEILTAGEVARLFRMSLRRVTNYDDLLKPFRTLGGDGHPGHRRYHRDVVVDAYEARLQERKP